MEQTSTQVLYWDTTENIVWGELDSTPQTLQTAEENIDAQARLRNTLGQGDDSRPHRYEADRANHTGNPKSLRW